MASESPSVSETGGSIAMPHDAAAHPWLATKRGQIKVAILVLVALRVVAGAVLPLSFDEAYYWLWSRHLAAGYYDHPPAIAYIIRLGTLVLGDTAFGVRAVVLLLSVAASWAVWRSARRLELGETAALTACLFFNLTLMVAVEMMAATPDAPALAGAAFLLLALTELRARDDGRWWLAVGAAGGFCLLSKYTAVFLGAGVLFWLAATREGWRWLKSPWPYLGAVVAVTLFAPVISWNAAHDWISIKFQASRTATGGFTARFLGEFLLAQLVLASPFILLLSGFGVARASRWGGAASALTLPAALIWPALVYFAVHATHDRVQGNWPSFLYPALAVLAAYATAASWSGRNVQRIVTVSRVLAVPAAALLLAAIYAQALFGVVSVRDPIARLTAMGFSPVAAEVATIAQREHAQAILTASYATTSWFAFYRHSPLPVIQVNEPFRWLSAPKADPRLGDKPLLLVALRGHGSASEVLPRFGNAALVAEVPRKRGKALIEVYDVYVVTGWRGGGLGRVP